MSSVALHSLVSAVGRPDATELIALATPAQVRELVDLEIWRGDRIDLPEALDWLHLLLTQLPEETKGRNMRALDVELIGCVLLRHLRVYLAEEEETIPDEPEGTLTRTPDGWFVLELLASEGSTVEQLTEIIDQIYRIDGDGARRLLQNLMWDLPTELEEWSYRWRNGRLQDLGFADPDDALRIYAYLDPDSVLTDDQTADRPLANDPDPLGSIDLVPTDGPQVDSFWSRAVASLPVGVEQQRVAQALMAVSNRALSADRIAPADLDGARASLEELHWRLSLGLEHLCGGDLDQAPQILASVALLRVARVGHSLALDRRRRVARGARSLPLGRGPGKVDLLDRPLRDQISALLGSRPRYFEAEVGDGRPFHDRRDLARADTWIDCALSTATLMQRANLPTPLPGGVTYGDLFRTALVHHLLDGSSLRPVPLLALRTFLERFVEEQRLRREVHDAALCVLGPAQGQEEEIVRQWTDELQAAVARLDPARIDLRFVDGLWLDR